MERSSSTTAAPTRASSVRSPRSERSYAPSGVARFTGERRLAWASSSTGSAGGRWLPRGGPTRDLDYHREVVAWRTPRFTKAASRRTSSGRGDDVSRYDVIVAPAAYLVREEQAKSITHRVRDGATLVATFFTGVVDENDRVHAGGAPGPLREVLGVTVEEFDAIPEGGTGQAVLFEPGMLGGQDGDAHAASVLCERVWLQGAKALASYTADFYAGDPAVTVNTYGKGKAYYVATHLAGAALAELLHAICGEHGVGSPLRDGKAPPPGVEVAARISPRGEGDETLLYPS